jgi:hypothetical protein
MLLSGYEGIQPRRAAAQRGATLRIAPQRNALSSSMRTPTMPAPIAQLSADTLAVTEALMAAPIGEVASLASLSAALGSDISLRRYIVASAIRIANREYGALFTSVRGIGYKRMPVVDACQIGETARSSIRRKARKAANTIMRAVEATNDLDDAPRKKAIGEASNLSLIAHISTDKARKSVPETGKPVAVAHVARAMLLQIGAIAA